MQACVVRSPRGLKGPISLTVEDGQTAFLLDAEGVKCLLRDLDEGLEHLGERLEYDEINPTVYDDLDIANIKAQMDRIMIWRDALREE